MKRQNNGSNLSELIRLYAFPLWPKLLVLGLLSFFSTILIAIQPALLSGLLELFLNRNANNTPKTPEKITNESFFNYFDLDTVGEKFNNFFISSNRLIEESNFDIALKILLIFLLISLFASAFNFLAQSMSSFIKSSSVKLIRKSLARHILSLDLAFFNNQKNGIIISRFINDASNTATGIGPLLHSLIHHGLLILIYSTYLIATDYLLAIGVVAIGLLQWVITLVVKRPVKDSQKSLLDKVANVTSILQETLQNIKLIKSFGADKYENKRIDKSISESANAEFKAGSVRVLDPNIRTFIDNISIAGIFLLGIIQLENNNLSTQGFLMFIFVGRLLITPINKFSVNFTWIHALLASYEQISKILMIQREIIDGKLDKKTFSDRLEINNISFSYGVKKALSSVSFDVRINETVAIVGSSGAGKSSLADLILRLYDPHEGTITIDGQDVSSIKISDYRNLFGVVSQENLLFNDSIANNVIFGREHLSLRDVREACKIANAHEFIEKLPKGYDTVVGDRGLKLSGGQRQRISIARSIVNKPEIILFDEATSSLDTLSERKVHDAIDSILKNKTAIIIAHRLSTIQNADKIIVMDEGKVAAIGTHQELLKKCSTYSNLYKLQLDLDNNLA